MLRHHQYTVGEKVVVPQAWSGLELGSVVYVIVELLQILDKPLYRIKAPAERFDYVVDEEVLLRHELGGSGHASYSLMSRYGDP